MSRPAFARRILRRNLAVALLVVVCVLLLRSRHPFLRLIHSHDYDIAYLPLLHAQFAVYIMTRACERHTATIARTFPAALVNLVVDNATGANPACEGLGNIFNSHPPERGAHSGDYMYRAKWAAVARACNTGVAIKCLVLEDDVVFVHHAERTVEVLVEQTMTFWNHDRSVYDCAARGFGWLPSRPTGTGTQCRVLPKIGSDRLASCLDDTAWEDGQLADGVMNWCLGAWNLPTSRFLLTQNTGLESVMVRKTIAPKAVTEAKAA